MPRAIVAEGVGESLVGKRARALSGAVLVVASSENLTGAVLHERCSIALLEQIVSALINAVADASSSRRGSSQELHAFGRSPSARPEDIVSYHR